MTRKEFKDAEFNKADDHFLSVLRIFYNIRLKDYFEMLETYFGREYKNNLNFLLGYSDADSKYYLKNTPENADIYEDITIGQMMLIARKMDNVPEDIEVPYPQNELHRIAYKITTIIMIEPFKLLFGSPYGKEVFEKITTKKNRKDE